MTKSSVDVEGPLVRSGKRAGQRAIQVFGCSTADEECQAIREVLSTGWLGMGQKVSEFEQSFAQHGNLKNFLMVDSGSNALYLAVKLLSLPPESEVILPSFTWVACAHAVLMAGCKPRFCDVEIDTGNVSRATIEPCLTQKTAAIMVVHHAGYPVDLDPIIDLGFPVIEDAAHASDAWYKERLCGSIGTIGIYSFNSVKNISTGGGGGITIRSRELYERAHALRYSGIGQSGYEKSKSAHFPWWNYEMREPFIKMIPSDLHAAVAIEQLKKIDRLQSRREAIWRVYQEKFHTLSWLKLPPSVRPECRHGYFSFVIRTTKYNRDSLAQYLLERGIYTTVRYPPLHHFPMYQEEETVLPNTEILFAESLCLPLHPALSDDEVTYIVDQVVQYPG
jgi:dTDP-4-amino-4,6-dideoxygalactose transaminase